MDAPLSKRCLAEVLATFCLVLMGCGAMAVDARTGALTHVGIAIVWGLVVMLMIYSVGSNSGAHMNPAVSIAFASQGRMPIKDAAAYTAAQCTGALLAALAIRGVLGVDQSMLGATSVQLDLPLIVGLAIEFVLTAILMFVVMSVSTGAREETITAGLAVGATIGVEAFVCGPLTKASMNPARSFGPAVASGDISQLWVYILGPVTGALVGAVLYRCIETNSRPPAES